MSCRQAFHIGPGKRYVNLEMIEVPILVEKTNELEEVLKVQTYMVDTKVSFLLGNNTLKMLNSKLDMKNNILETCIDGLDKNFKMVDTSGNHYVLVLETRKEEVKIV